MLKIKEEKFMYYILIILVLFIVCICMMPPLNYVNVKANSQVESNEYIGYTNYDKIRLDMCSKRNTYNNMLPSLTFLVHGQGGNASHWSNVSGRFEYDAMSLIEQIGIAVGAEKVVYKAKVYMKCIDKIEDHNTFTSDGNKKYYQCNKLCERGFYLTKIKKVNDKYIEQVVDKIDSFGHHSIVIFEASQMYRNGDNVIYGGNTSSHDVAYMELEYVIDKILTDYRYITGILPKINFLNEKYVRSVLLFYQFLVCWH